MATPQAASRDANVPSLRQQIVLNELDGKNAAAQAYDERIWKIRTGFLTLVFAAWGALLTAAGNNSQILGTVALPMCLVTTGLAFAGAWVDHCYLRRKYRCVRMINEMLPLLFEHIDRLESIPQEYEKRWLSFSGDDPNVDPKDGTTYLRSLSELIAIYLIPVIGIWVGFLLLPQVLPTIDG